MQDKRPPFFSIFSFTSRARREQVSPFCGKLYKAGPSLGATRGAPQRGKLHRGHGWPWASAGSPGSTHGPRPATAPAAQVPGGRIFPAHATMPPYNARYVPFSPVTGRPERSVRRRRETPAIAVPRLEATAHPGPRKTGNFLPKPSCAIRATAIHLARHRARVVDSSVHLPSGHDV